MFNQKNQDGLIRKTTRGAWEIRWLAWRFRTMGGELENTVQHLLAAERKAREYAGAGTARETVHPDGEAPVPRVAPSENAGHVRSDELEDLSLRLENMSPNEPHAGKLAREAWAYYRLEAEKIGAVELKNRLENAAFRILEPDEYARLGQELKAMTTALSGWAEDTMKTLALALEADFVPYSTITFRVKHIAGVWSKCRNKNLSIEQIHDLYAFRVVVPAETDCYWALGVIHRTFTPVPGRFKDYITSPKANGYQSLHTCVHAGQGPVFEVQIRSVAMHRHAETGSAAHWVYKGSQALPGRHERGLLGRLVGFTRSGAHSR